MTQHAPPSQLHVPLPPLPPPLPPVPPPLPPDGRFEENNPRDDFLDPFVEPVRRRRSTFPACRPVDEADPLFHYLYLGWMNVECPNCHALHWMCEKLSKSSEANPKFGTCCLSGKVSLPYLQPLPHDLHALYFGEDDSSNHFLQKIRFYNNAFSMASLGVKIDNTVNQGTGPHVFKIQGALYHNHDQLLPNENGNKKYAQIYFMDNSLDQINCRMANNQANDLRIDVLTKIQGVLYQNNVYVQRYRHAFERIRLEEQRLQRENPAKCCGVASSIY